MFFFSFLDHLYPSMNVFMIYGFKWNEWKLQIINYKKPFKYLHTFGNKPKRFFKMRTFIYLILPRFFYFLYPLKYVSYHIFDSSINEDSVVYGNLEVSESSYPVTLTKGWRYQPFLKYTLVRTLCKIFLLPIEFLTKIVTILILKSCFKFRTII